MFVDEYNRNHVLLYSNSQMNIQVERERLMPEKKISKLKNKLNFNSMVKNFSKRYFSFLPFLYVRYNCYESEIFKKNWMNNIEYISLLLTCINHSINLKKNSN